MAVSGRLFLYGSVRNPAVSRNVPNPTPESNGMDAPTLNGINVPKWKCHRPLDEDRSVHHEYYNRRYRSGEERVSGARR